MCLGFELLMMRLKEVSLLDWFLLNIEVYFYSLAQNLKSYSIHLAMVSKLNLTNANLL